MAKKKLKVYTLEEAKDRHLGKRGTPGRDRFEFELQMSIIGDLIKQARKHRNLTQEQLGELVGVQKAQISKLESSVNSATIDTVVKVFKALNAEIKMNVKLDDKYMEVI